MAKAVCVLKGDGCGGIITFTQASEEAPTKIEGKVYYNLFHYNFYY